MDKKIHTFGTITYEITTPDKDVGLLTKFDELLSVSYNQTLPEGSSSTLSITNNNNNDEKEKEYTEHKNQIVKNIYCCGYTDPTPIQKLAIPFIISGKDMIMQSPSGTGKTATFTIGTMMRIMPNSGGIGMIIANTHQLAKQIYETFKMLDNKNEYYPVLCVGGLGKDLLPGDKKKLFQKHYEELEKSNVIIGTVGAIYDKIKKNKIKRDNVKMCVVDEADKIMNDIYEKDKDYGDSPNIKQIIQTLPGKGECQIVFCSATFDDMILKDVNQCLGEDTYTKILMTKNNVNLQGIKQFKIDMSNITHVHEDESKFCTLEDIYRCFPAHRAFIFVNSRERGDRLRLEMTKNGFCVDVVHGGMSNKEQEEKLKYLDKGDITALISTDISGRGIDIQHLNLVINYDLPCNQIEDYIHRIGRCGRYGRKGLAISFVNNRKDKAIISHIEEEYSINIENMPDPDKLKEILSDNSSGF